MNTFSLLKFGSVINDDATGDVIYTSIKKDLAADSNPLVVDFDGIITMATFCAKQIFGRLFIEMGQENFAARLILKNASSDLRFIVRTGIDNAIENKPQ